MIIYSNSNYIYILKIIVLYLLCSQYSDLHLKVYGSFWIPVRDMSIVKDFIGFSNSIRPSIWISSAPGRFNSIIGLNWILFFCWTDLTSVVRAYMFTSSIVTLPSRLCMPFWLMRLPRWKVEGHSLAWRWLKDSTFWVCIQCKPFLIILSRFKINVIYFNTKHWYYSYRGLGSLINNYL